MEVNILENTSSENKILYSLYIWYSELSEKWNNKTENLKYIYFENEEKECQKWYYYFRYAF